MSDDTRSATAPLRISVIIPTLNEADRIAAVIDAVREIGACEVLVVDGGSDDETVARAAAADRVLRSARGRAVQQNLGAQRASGDVLLFLHADCRLDPKAFDAIRELFASPRCVAGCFRQRIDEAGIGFRLLEAGNALRVRCLGWAYGDQALFLKREVFEALGGFPELALMEDLYFCKRLKRAGRIALVTSSRVHVSARRWQRTGILRQTCRNWFLVTLAHLGISPSRLAALYPHVR